MTSSNIPLLQFIPILKEKIWGGSALVTRFGKNASPSAAIGESWEISGYAGEETIVKDGPYAGQNLGQLCRRFNATLCGNVNCNPFPLLYKLIDARDKLSIQVHPDDQQSQKNRWGVNGKTECWYIIDAEPGAKIICGFNRNVTSREVRERIAANSLEDILNYIDIKAGDLLFVPSGTVHAILGGTILYETQQTSDVTFRIYDWGRLDSKGHSRQLHIEQAISVLDTSAHNYHKIPAIHLDSTGSISRFFRVACRYFAIQEYRFDAAASISLAPKQSFQVIIVIEGTLEIRSENNLHVLRRGQSALLPACLSNVDVYATKGSSFLVSWVPNLKNEVVKMLKERGFPNEQIKLLGGNPNRNDVIAFLK